ncbi:MAG TPA: G1 family glutamic endopeptidase [Candidatus Dormibacteraeota bacterium]|nr:G1 family glutamic endopeptidase [Candidatus Dormibacteraeota bacterium]
MDTRANGEALGPGASLNLTVAGGTVPSGATAVALNVTVTDTTAASYLSVYPSGGSRPVVSNLNWVAGETVPNLVIVPVGASGQVTFYNHSGQTDVLVDLEGYFAPEASGSTAGSYVPLVPARITDTRTGSGFPNAGSPLSAGASLNIQVTGAGGVATTGITAALMNVTVTDTTAASFLTAYPSGATLPTASNLNWVAGETVANRVVVPVGPTGQITLYNHSGNTDVIVDVDGYFTNGSTTPTRASLYLAITPVRVVDTRQTSGPLGGGTTIGQQLAGVDGIGSSASAVVSNVTAVNTTAASYFTVYPSGTSRPTASDVNWSAGQIVPNLTVATLSSSGSVSIYNNAGSADLILDAFGYFSPLSTLSTPLAITTTSLPGATVGTAYSVTLAASGGTPPYTWSLASGSLPPGLSLSSSGVISGTPTTSGNTSFGVTVTDSTTPTPETATAQLSLSVASTATTLAITTTSLPGATVGTAYSVSLAASGGTPPYSWSLTSGSLPPGLSLSSSGVISGTPTTSGNTSFGVTVTDSTTPTPETATATFSISVASQTTTVVSSSNWSGYVVGNGPYTSVQGTFDVPNILSSSTNTDTAEWVGIDGFTNTSLIQAGINEPYDASTKTYVVQAWWEILPASATPISMTVSPGDSITVTIGQISGTDWAITLTDNTTAQTFTTDQTYTGPLTSAEWILEAPTVSTVQSTLGPYSPDVTFTGLGISGPQSNLTEIIMVQNGVQVSTPSPLDSTGFNVAYGDVAPAPP